MAGNRDSSDAPTWDAATLSSPVAFRAGSLRPPQQPSTFEDRYRPESKLGEGGMGIVTLCLDRAIGRRVAMKVVREGAGSGADGVQRFVREARVQGQLEHPSIVPVYDLGLDPTGSAFFTMKRVRGTTLHDVVQSLRDGNGDPRWSRRRLLTAFGSVCLAIDYAHQHGVIHRDLKPSNVMLGAFGEVYALDWGLARVAGTELPHHEQLEIDPAEGGRTVAGAIMGTPGYMAPEQARGDNAAMGPWTDVYALGCLLYELLTLEPLVDGASGADLLAKTLAGVDARASLRVPDANVPPELEALIVRATALDPKERLASARELSDALEAFLDGERDIELRREMASRHAKTALEAAARARTEETLDQRRNALRELSRALALDPENQQAVETLVKLMADPPRRLPPEVAIEIAGNQRHRVRRVARIGALAYMSMLLYLPFFLWSGVREWKWVIALYACAIAASAMSMFASVRKNPSDGSVLATMVLSNLAFAATAPLFGPLVLTPTLVAVNAMGFALNLPRRHRPWAIAIGSLAAGIPVLMSLAGWLPGGYSFSGDTMIVSAGALHLPAVPTLVMLGSVAIASVITGSLSVVRVRDALDEAERQIYVYAWHMREFLPEAARASTDPTGARRAMAMRTPPSLREDSRR